MRRTGGSADGSVQATNDDATVSKLSCALKGYFHDDFVRFFVRRPSRRAPVINRGYYARWAAVRLLLDRFVAMTEERRQLLSLGAGYDTLFFQRQAEGRAGGHFFEVDFAEVTCRKAAMIDSHPEMKDALGPSAKITAEQGKVESDNYHLLPADLRDLTNLDSVLTSAGLDPNLPTFILAECVLIYMDPVKSRALVQWAAQKFPNSVFLVYEQIRPDDAFGQQMILNLESRGCPLLGIQDTPSLEAKTQRFTDLGYERAEVLDMDFIYNKVLDLTDVRRIERLEIFDEFEEWHIMQEHYCIAIGVNDRKGSLRNFGFKSVGTPEKNID